MLRCIINFGKKLLLAVIVAAMIVTSVPKNIFADYSENEIRNVDVVVRAGEWANENQAKPGKRYIWGSDINISQHGISAKEIPTDIPLRCENNEWFISEFDINLKLARAIAKKLDSKYGVDVNLQYADNKSEDLNAAGRIAAKCNPKVYLSVHHNSFKDDTTGYFFMSNEGDTASSVFAKRLADAMAANGMIPQRDNRANDGYIGELNKVKAENRISILGEFGYFNKAEIVKICSDEYVNYVSDKVAESIYVQLKEMDAKNIKQASEKLEPVEMAKEEKPVVEEKVAEPKFKIVVEEMESIDKAQENAKALQDSLDEINQSMTELNKTMEELEQISVNISNDVVTIDNVEVEHSDVVVLSFR
jgi:hypothetical protein